MNNNTEQRNEMSQNIAGNASEHSGSENPVPAMPNVVKREPIYSKTVRNQFSWLWKICVIYGLSYLLFGYRNYDGIGVGFFTLISAVFVLWVAKRLQREDVEEERNIRIPKISSFYLLMAVLLGFCSCTTDNDFFLFFNFIGSVLLFTIACLKMVYNDRKWDFDKYIECLFSFWFQMLEMLPVPFRDIAVFRKHSNRKMSPNTRYVLIGIAISVPILLVIIPLLASADQVFSGLIGNIFDFERMYDWLFSDFLGNVFLAPGSFVFFALLLYLIFVTLCKGTLKEEVKECTKYSTVIAVTIFSVVDLVYVLFSGIQFLYLFGGLPSGYEYAAYAREGFFELLFVAVINFFLVLICNKCFPKNLLLKVLMTITCGCTYVMIASSAYRMFLYIDVYHLTFLRVFVLWFLVVLSFFMAGSIVSIYKDSWNSFRYCLFVITCFYTVFAMANIDGRIAEYNVAQFDKALQTAKNESQQSGEAFIAPKLKNYLPDEYTHSKAYAPALDKLRKQQGANVGENNLSLIHNYFNTEEHFSGYYCEEYDEEGESKEVYVPAENTAIYSKNEKADIFMWRHYNFIESFCYKKCEEEK